MRREPGGDPRLARLPAKRENILGGWGRLGAGVPLAVELDGAGRVPQEGAFSGEHGEGTGRLVGERLQFQGRGQSSVSRGARCRRTRPKGLRPSSAWMNR